MLQCSMKPHVQNQGSSSCMLICTAPGVLIDHTSNILRKLLQMNAHSVVLVTDEQETSAK